MSFPRALLSSIPRLLFLMLVCVGFIAFIALPGVGEKLGGLVCETGEQMTSVSTSYSRPGESGTSVEYFCSGPGGDRAVGMGDMLIAVLMIYVALFVLVIWPLLALSKLGKHKYEDLMRREGVPARVTIVSARQTNTRINDAPVVKFEFRVEPQGLPAFTKKMRKTVYEMDIPGMQPARVFSGLVHPRKPDKVLILFDEPAAPDVTVTHKTITMDQLPPQFADLVAKAVGAAGASTSSAGFGESNDEIDALRALKAMRDEGLISEADYAAKKAEIMGRM